MRIVNYQTGVIVGREAGGDLVELSRRAGPTGAVLAYQEPGERAWFPMAEIDRRTYERLGYRIATVYVED